MHKITEDTPKDDTRNDILQHEDVGLGASTAEGALIGSVAVSEFE